MPFQSKAQARWMFANHPQMARRWAHETPGGIKSLPDRVKGNDVKKMSLEEMKAMAAVHRRGKKRKLSKKHYDIAAMFAKKR